MRLFFLCTCTFYMVVSVEIVHITKPLVVGLLTCFIPLFFFNVLPEVTGTATAQIIYEVGKQSTAIQLGTM